MPCCRVHISMHAAAFGCRRSVTVNAQLPHAPRPSTSSNLGTAIIMLPVYEKNLCGYKAKRFQLRSRGSPGWAAAG